MPLNTDKITLQQRQEWTEITSNILKVASMLDDDELYTRESAVEDLVKIVDQMEA